MSRSQSRDSQFQKRGSVRLHELEARLLHEIQDVDHIRHLAYEAAMSQENEGSLKIHTESEHSYPGIPSTKPSTWSNVWYHIDPTWKSLSIKQKILSILHQPMNSPFGFYFSILIALIILSSITITILQTSILGKTSNIDQIFQEFLMWYKIELAISCFLIVELVVEAIVTPSLLIWFKTTSFWIKFISLLPFFLETIVLIAGKQAFVGETAFRAFMFCRIARLFRLFSLSSIIREDSGIFLQAVKSSAFPLLFLIYYLIGSVLLFSGLIYFAETDSCILLNTGQWVYSDSIPSNTYIVSSYAPNVSYDPNSDQKLSQFQSIPDAMWWAIVTMTTVGYGDKYPITTLGKLVASLCMVVSLIMIPLPMTIFSANLTELYLDYRSQKRTKKRAQDILERYKKELEEEEESSEISERDEMKLIPKDKENITSTIIDEKQSKELSRVSTLLELIEKFYLELDASMKLSKQGLDDMSSKQELIGTWISEAREKLQQVDLNIPKEIDQNITLKIDAGSDEM